MVNFNSAGLTLTFEDRASLEATSPHRLSQGEYLREEQPSTPRRALGLVQDSSHKQPHFEDGTFAIIINLVAASEDVLVDTCMLISKSFPFLGIWL